MPTESEYKAFANELLWDSPVDFSNFRRESGIISLIRTFIPSQTKQIWPRFPCREIVLTVGAFP